VDGLDCLVGSYDLDNLFQRQFWIIILKFKACDYNYDWIKFLVFGCWLFVKMRVFVVANNQKQVTNNFWTDSHEIASNFSVRQNSG